MQAYREKMNKLSCMFPDFVVLISTRSTLISYVLFRFEFFLFRIKIFQILLPLWLKALIKHLTIWKQMVTLAYLEKCFTLNLMTVPSSQGGESRTSVISVHSRSVPSDGCNKTRARTNDRSGIPNNSAAWSVSLKDNGSCTVTGSWNSTSLLHRILSIGPANISLFLNSLLRNSCI